MRRRFSAVAAVSAALLVVVALGGTALAGHLTDGVKSYTGCLATSGGTLTLIKEGNAPQKACPSGSVVAHFSGGDITKISVTGALTLPDGGDNGEVTIGLDPKFSLPQSCANAQVAKWSSATSAWICAADNDTTYSESTGLDLSTGNAFSIEPGYRLPGKACSTAGQFATGFDSTGAIQCQAPASNGLEVWQKIRPDITAGTVIVLPQDEGVDLITMPLPAGTFLMTGVASAKGRSADELFVACGLRDGAFQNLPVQHSALNITDGAIGDVGGVVTVHGVVSLANADSVRFTCTSGADDGEVEGATLTAIKVGTLHTP